jgi:hypothetical protein
MSQALHSQAQCGAGFSSFFVLGVIHSFLQPLHLYATIFVHIALPQIISVDSNINLISDSGKPVENERLLCDAVEKKSESATHYWGQEEICSIWRNCVII